MDRTRHEDRGHAPARARTPRWSLVLLLLVAVGCGRAAEPAPPTTLARDAQRGTDGAPAPAGAPAAVVEEAEEGPVIHDAAVADHVETDNDLPFEEGIGGDAGISDAPFSGPSNNGLIGLGGGAAGGLRGRGGNRGLLGEGDRPDTEGYDRIGDNPFVRVADQDASTFSIDVDTAAYANVRRFLAGEGRLPPVDAVRIEELLNYFPYAYAPPGPEDEHPFRTHVAVAACPWAPEHRLVRVGIQGRVMEEAERPPVNLVFLIDVSGSMRGAAKLPLLRAALGLLVDRLRADDRVAIAVYAGAAGMVLPPTPGDRHAEIRGAIDRLEAGGSTNGGAGIQLAYAMAKDGLVEGGVNRVLLCTDGDFNVGVSDRGSLTRYVEEQARAGIDLTVLGFGTGNLKDDRMEELSNRGNGNYAYVDGLREAQKVLVEQGVGTLVTIARDVKIQVFFNPLEVAGWRLIGYENRRLRREDFQDDTKDAGEIGAGHSVTALYEVVPVGAALPGRPADANPFVAPPAPSREAFHGALLRLRLRYKPPEGGESILVEEDVTDAGADFAVADADLRWAAAVAAFGLVLRDDEHRGACSWPLVEELAAAAVGEDVGGYRTEMLELVRTASALAAR